MSIFYIKDKVDSGDIIRDFFPNYIKICINFLSFRVWSSNPMGWLGWGLRLTSKAIFGFRLGVIRPEQGSNVGNNKFFEQKHEGKKQFLEVDFMFLLKITCFYKTHFSN